jgi:hypothetical protein
LIVQNGGITSTMDGVYKSVNLTPTGTITSDGQGNGVRQYTVTAGRSPKTFGGSFNTQQALGGTYGAKVDIPSGSTVYGGTLKVLQGGYSAEIPIPTSMLPSAANGWSMQIDANTAVALGISGVTGVEINLDVDGAGTYTLTGFAKATASTTTQGQPAGLIVQNGGITSTMNDV